MASHEVVSQSEVHYVSKNNIGIYVTLKVGGDGCGVAMGFLFFFLDFDISQGSCFSGLDCSRIKIENEEQHLECESD